MRRSRRPPAAWRRLPRAAACWWSRQSDRTSPVKRGLFILDNILGTPPRRRCNVRLRSRRRLQRSRAKSCARPDAHREKPQCVPPTHGPLGLAFENFNALGMWRAGAQQPIDTAGKLIWARPPDSVRELKQLLVTKHRRAHAAYRKFLTYAVGAGWVLRRGDH
jgi:hypothetical protein